MARYMVRRILNIIPLILLATLIAFSIMQAAPGGPENFLLQSEQDARIDPARLEKLREKWGLNDPIHVQYYRWVTNVMVGDFGDSFFQGRPVAEVIAEALPNTIRLNLIVLALIYGISIPLGVISAVKQYSVLDYIVTSIAFIGQAAPVQWVALMAIYGIAMKSGNLIPTNGIATPGVNWDDGFWVVVADRAKYMVLPVLVSTFSGLTGLTRYMRASMLEVLKEDYVRTARAKGLSDRVVIYKHALRNALLPIITISGGLLSNLVSGSVIIEFIFSWPGIGRVGYDAVIQRDYPVVMAILLMSAVMLLVGYLLVDIAYVFVDPRIKYD